jgi:hypothetical protein
MYVHYIISCGVEFGKGFEWRAGSARKGEPGALATGGTGEARMLPPVANAVIDMLRNSDAPHYELCLCTFPLT